VKVSLFKLGLGLAIIGIIWISFIFIETEKTHDTILLKKKMQKDYQFQLKKF